MNTFVTFSQLGYMGELGNQMFQVAAAIAYGKKYGKIPIFPSWTCKIDGKNYTSSVFKGQVDQSLDQFRFSHIHNRHTYNDLSYIEIPHYEGNVDLVGYYQSEKYFQNSKDEIRELFQPSEHIKDYIQEKYGDILGVKNKVSLHMRTGRRGKNDYDVHSTPDYEFVEKSQSYYDDPLYVVFADNMDFAKTLLPSGKRYFFVENEKNYIDMFFMTCFDSYIVPNSTFGWWGAWLSRAENPKVVVMENWFDPNKEKAYLNNNDVIPDRWIKVDGHFNNRK